MTMKFHETVMALLSFISTYFPFLYISVTSVCKCLESIAAFVSSQKVKFHDGSRVGPDHFPCGIKHLAFINAAKVDAGCARVVKLMRT